MISLDVGCGYSPEHIKKAELGIDLEKGLCDVQASAYQIPFRSGSFQKIVMSHVLEHLTNFGMALDEVKRVLQPKGLLEIEVPNPYAFFRIKDTITGHGLRGEAEDHVASYCVENLRNIARLNGFEIQAITYIHSFWVEKELKKVSVAKRFFFKMVYKFKPSMRTIIKVTFKN